MYLLSVNLYEFGLFLQILLWISLPMVVVALLVTTYLHYRKKRRRKLEDDYVAGDPVEVNPDNNGNAYRGLLWMKDKYEQYREQTDNRYEKVKEELARSEQKYLELLSERGEQGATLSPAFRQAVTLEKNALSGGNFPEESSIQREGSGEESILQAGLSEESALQVGLPEKSLLHLNSPEESLLPLDKVPEETSIPDLVAEKERQIGFLHIELDQRIKNYYELEYQNREDKARADELAGQYLQAQQRQEAQQLKIDELNALLGQEMSRTVDLTGKLEDNMRLLLHIHQELDRSLHPVNKLPASEAQTVEEVEEDLDDWMPGKEGEPGPDQSIPLPEDTKIVAWIECEEIGATALEERSPEEKFPEEKLERV